MLTGKKYKPGLIQGNYDAIVIGSGVGGLSTAGFLARQGKKVLVLEKHYTAGGFSHTYMRKGYEWDVGVHYIGKLDQKTSFLRRVFDYLSDDQLQWAFMGKVYDQIIFPDQKYDFVVGREAFVESLGKSFPQEKDNIWKYLKLIQEVSRSSQKFFGQRALSPFLGKIFSPLMKGKFLSYSNKTTLEVLQSITSNPKLIGVLAGQYGDYGLPPAQSSFAIHALVADHYIFGGNYPVGGASMIAKTMIPAIEKAGGQVIVNAGVEEILTKNNQVLGVRLEKGDEIHSPMVISNAGVFNTFEKLLPSSIAQKHDFPTKLKTVSPSTTHICLYIGMKESSRDLGLQKANLWIYPDYDHDSNVAKFLQNSEEELPLVYASFPSAKDPDWDRRFLRMSTIELLSLAPYEWFAKWQDKPWRKRGDEYEELKENYASRLLQKLYEQVPQVKGKIDYYELSTPLSTRHFCQYQHGEIYGIDHTPERFRQKWLTPRTPVSGLYLTGQDIATNGIAGALMSGVVCASAILGKNLIKEVVKNT